MTFDFVRSGWPNIVAIAALAAMPLVTLSMPANLPAAQSVTSSSAEMEFVAAATTQDAE